MEATLIEAIINLAHAIGLVEGLAIGILIFSICNYIEDRLRLKRLAECFSSKHDRKLFEAYHLIKKKKKIGDKIRGGGF